MNTPCITAILAVTALSFNSGAVAESLSGSEYRAAEYMSAKKSCNLFARNARDICMAEASRIERVAKARLYAVAREMPGMSAACIKPPGNYSRAG